MRLDNFEGPFDLLLSLIAKHKLDITEVSLSTVTDEFIAHVKAGGPDWDLEQTTSFLLVAATLLDLKAARLLPQGDVEDEEDLALLEARDLLFARLLQYRAFKQVAAVLEQRLAAESRRHPRAVGLEERFASLLPEVLIGHRARAVRARSPRRRWSPSRCRAVARTTSTRPRSACASRRPWSSTGCAGGHDDLPRAVRRLAGHADDGGAVPVAARAVPRGRGRLRPGDAAGRADRPVDRRRRRAMSTTITDEFDGAPPEADGDRRAPTATQPRSNAAETTMSRDHRPTEATLDVPVAELRPSLEAVLMVADQPLDHVALATAVGYPVDEVTAALAALAAEYAEQGRGFELRNVGGGWRYYTRDEYAAVVEGFVLDGQQARLTQAALETLAVVAYKQPVSRARVSAIRGVNVDGVMRTLLTRGLVEEAGQDHETGAHLYRTTGYFLERIGVTSLDELPELAPYLPDMDDLEDELARWPCRRGPTGPAPTGASGPSRRAPAPAAQR